jgi:hypothetical protein
MLAHDKNPVQGFRGGRIGREAKRQAEHFHLCGDCGQAFDLRSLAQVTHHDRTGHKPLSEAELSQLSH